jgi:hypothetical protein
MVTFVIDNMEQENEEENKLIKAMSMEFDTY